MNYKILLLMFDIIFDNGQYWSEESVVPIENPIRVNLRITNTVAEIQKLQRVNLRVEYENPVNSGKVGYWNKRLNQQAIRMFGDGLSIQRGSWLPSDNKQGAAPLTDGDFIPMKPGEKGTMIWQINLNELGMIEGTHQYEIFVVGNHVLPSVVEEIYRKKQKHALSTGTKSNTVTFKYTKLRNETKTVFRNGSFLGTKKLCYTKLPISTNISVISTTEELQILHQVQIEVVYKNPADSGTIGYLCERSHEMVIFNKGRRIGENPRLPTVKRRPDPWPKDSIFVELKPGEQYTTVRQIYLNNLDMLEGEHQYELLLWSSSFSTESTSANSNTVIFTYTEPPQGK